MKAYEWDCPNCGEHISTFTLPPKLGADERANYLTAVDALKRVEKEARAVLRRLREKVPA